MREMESIDIGGNTLWIPYYEFDDPRSAYILQNITTSCHATNATASCAVYTTRPWTAWEATPWAGTIPDSEIPFAEKPEADSDLWREPTLEEICEVFDA